jgi:hypothetical protein
MAGDTKIVCAENLELKKGPWGLLIEWVEDVYEQPVVEATVFYQGEPVEDFSTVVEWADYRTLVDTLKIEGNQLLSKLKGRTPENVSRREIEYWGTHQDRGVFGTRQRR